MSKGLATLVGGILILGFTIGTVLPSQAGEPCQGRTGQPGFFYKAITSGGLVRLYLLYVPPGYQPDQPTPLVFNLHGLNSDGWTNYYWTRMDVLASEFNFILVTPYGYEGSWNVGGCCGPAGDLVIDDVGFVSDMIDSISEEYCVDQDRIHAMGPSNGAYMSWRLACDLSERISAIGPVAGLLLGPDPCLPSRPVSVIALHGTDDEAVPHSDNLPPWGAAGLPTTLAWASGMCTDTTEVVYAEGEVTCFAYTDCLEHGRVEFCSVEGGGHTWPGGAPYPAGGHTTQDIDASREIAKFFMRWYRVAEDTACNDGLDNDGDDLIDLDDPDCTDRSDSLEASDADGDLIEDSLDNCVQVSNPSQEDTDGDDYGNACDCDFDQTLTCGIQDFNVFLPDFIATVDSGVGTDMDSSGRVGIGDFNLFLPCFVAGAPGPSGLVP